MRIADHVKDAVRERADLAEVIGYYVPLTQKGREYKARCPFHEEKTASFLVHTDGRWRGFWKCFGCGVKGDVFKFVQLIERVSFPESIRILAERYGIALEEEEDGPGARAAENKRRLLAALDRASTLYEMALFSKSELGERGRAYLTERGIEEETARTWRLGIAPPEWDRVGRRLREDGFSPEVLEAAGLCRARKGGKGQWDFLRDRMIFPITDAQGRVVALAGRSLPQPASDEEEGDGDGDGDGDRKGDAGPKYLNTQETMTFHKREVLYGFDKAWRRSERPERLILTEGYTDVILAHQAGFHGAVACLGTAFGDEHAKLVKRVGPALTLLFDGDAAGERAALRTIEVCVRNGLEADVVALPEGMDPADLVVQRGPEPFAEALAAPMGAIDFCVDVVKSQEGEGANGSRVADRVLPIAAAAPDPLRRAELARDVAAKLGFALTTINERLATFIKEQARRDAGSRRWSGQGGGPRSGESRRKGPHGGAPAGGPAVFANESPDRDGSFEHEMRGDGPAPQDLDGYAPAAAQKPPGVLDRSVANLMVVSPAELLAEYPDLASGQGVEHPQCRVIVRVAAEMFEAREDVSPQRVLDALPEGQREAALEVLLLEEQPDERPDLQAEVQQVAARLRARARKEQLRQLRAERAEALRRGDLERAEALFQQLASLATQQSSP